MLIAVVKDKFIVSIITIFGTLSFPMVHRRLRPRPPCTMNSFSLSARRRVTQDATQPTPSSRDVSLRTTLQRRRCNGIDMAIGPVTKLLNILEYLIALLIMEKYDVIQKTGST